MAILGEWLLVNGKLAAANEARVGLDDVDVLYGYGCYEVLKLRENRVYFAAFHEERLLSSARILGFAHELREGFLEPALLALVRANGLENSNIRVLLIAHSGRPADWFAFQVPALVPPENSEQEGVSCLLYAGERSFPQAKSLNMLMSTIAFREAETLGCYDALLYSRDGIITEGTRTNLFWIWPDRPDVLCTTPAARVLSGITRRTVWAVAEALGWAVREEDLPAGLFSAGTDSTAVPVKSSLPALFLTSTSSVILPVRRLLVAPHTPGMARIGTVLREWELPLLPVLTRLQAGYRDWLADGETALS